MSVGTEERPDRTGRPGFLLAGRVLAATFLTALVGAIQNWLYEWFYPPDPLGPYLSDPLARGVFTLALAFPFILAGLLVLGFPTAYVLRRLRVENALSYALAGTVTGALWGAIVLRLMWGSVTSYGQAVSAFYGCSCALIWWWLRPRG